MRVVAMLANLSHSKDLGDVGDDRKRGRGAERMGAYRARR